MPRDEKFRLQTSHVPTETSRKSPAPSLNRQAGNFAEDSAGCPPPRFSPVPAYGSIDVASPPACHCQMSFSEPCCSDTYIYSTLVSASLTLHHVFSFGFPQESVSVGLQCRAPAPCFSSWLPAFAHLRVVAFAQATGDLAFHLSEFKVSVANESEVAG